MKKQDYVSKVLNRVSSYSRDQYKRFKQALSEQDWRCTLFFNGVWRHCCIWHDICCADARAQKSQILRYNADRDLRDCVNNKLPGMGDFMYRWIRRYLKYRKRWFGKPMY